MTETYDPNRPVRVEELIQLVGPLVSAISQVGSATASLAKDQPTTAMETLVAALGDLTRARAAIQQLLGPEAADAPPAADNDGEG